MTERLASFVAWHAEISPGDSFRVPAQWVLPHAGDFWGGGMRVLERPTDPVFGDWACVSTFALTPGSDTHWIYEAEVGECRVWHDIDSGRPVHQRYLGVYRVWGLSPNAWATGTLGFAAAPDLSEGKPQ